MQEVEQGDGERYPAEHAVVVERDDGAEARAQPGLQPALAGERDARIFDRQIAQIECLSEREETDDQEKIGLARARQEQAGCHDGTMPPPSMPDNGAVSGGLRSTERERRF